MHPTFKTLFIELYLQEVQVHHDIRHLILDKHTSSDKEMLRGVPFNIAKFTSYSSRTLRKNSIALLHAGKKKNISTIFEAK